MVEQAFFIFEIILMIVRAGKLLVAHTFYFQHLRSRWILSPIASVHLPSFTIVSVHIVKKWNGFSFSECQHDCDIQKTLPSFTIAEFGASLFFAIIQMICESFFLQCLC